MTSPDPSVSAEPSESRNRLVLVVYTAAIFVSALTDPDGAAWSPNLVVLNFIDLPLTLVFHIFGETDKIGGSYGEVSFAVLLVANLAWIVVFAVITRWRYQRVEVTR